MLTTAQPPLTGRFFPTRTSPATRSPPANSPHSCASAEGAGRTPKAP